MIIEHNNIATFLLRFRFIFYANDERMHHYQRRRTAIIGLSLNSGIIIVTERLVGVVTAMLVGLLDF
jgi:hypothetical protein